jgi:PAS domain S-box-containing protein
MTKNADMDRQLQDGPRSEKQLSISSDDYMTLINRHYTYDFASELYCVALGKTRKDVLKNSAIDLWGEETFTKVIKKCLDRCFRGEEVHVESWLNVPGLGRRFYDASYYPYYDEQGQVTHAVAALYDNTERKDEEEVLKKGATYFRAVLRNMHFGVFSFDLEGRFTYVNDVITERTGYTREWFAGKSLFDFVRREERDEVRRHFEMSRRGAPMPPYEFAYYGASGNLAWVQVNTTPIREEGRVVGILGVLLDITKRKNSEQALKESEEKYRMLFEDSRDAIFVTDGKGQLTDANRSFLELFGYDKKETVGLSLMDTYANREERKACVRAIQESGFVKDFELKLKKNDGSIMDCVLTGTARIAADGTTMTYHGIVRDVTEQKRIEQALSDSEQKLASVVFGSPIPQFVIDENHVVTHWNKALEMVSGIKAEEVVGTRHHWRAFYRSERPCIADLVLDMAVEEIPKWYRDAEWKQETKDNVYNYKTMAFFEGLGEKGKWLCLSAAALKDAKGKLVGAVETLEDVTEHKIVEDASRKAEERYHNVSNNSVVGLENNAAAPWIVK